MPLSCQAQFYAMFFYMKSVGISPPFMVIASYDLSKSSSFRGKIIIYSSKKMEVLKLRIKKMCAME